MIPNRTFVSAQSLIELLAELGPLTPADISARTGVARSSVYRLAEGLAAVGLTESLPDSRIGLGNRWLRLADAVQPAMSEWAEAPRILGELAARTGQTIFLSVPRGKQAICIAWVQGRGIDLLVLKPGRSLPLYAGAAGRNILANTGELIEPLLTSAPFPALTTKTLTTADELQADIARTLAEGYTMSDEDVTIGIGAIGVPVFGADGLLGCLSAAGLVQDIRAGETNFLPALRAAAHELAKSAE